MYNQAIATIKKTEMLTLSDLNAFLTKNALRDKVHGTICDNIATDMRKRITVEEKDSGYIFTLPLTDHGQDYITYITDFFPHDRTCQQETHYNFQDGNTSDRIKVAGKELAMVTALFDHIMPETKDINECLRRSGV